MPFVPRKLTLRNSKTRLRRQEKIKDFKGVSSTNLDSPLGQENFTLENADKGIKELKLRDKNLGDQLDPYMLHYRS
jgi:hypothetical protein